MTTSRAGAPRHRRWVALVRQAADVVLVPARFSGWPATARITEGGAAELLQRLARPYLGPDVRFPATALPILWDDALRGLQKPDTVHGRQ